MSELAIWQQARASFSLGVLWDLPIEQRNQGQTPGVGVTDLPITISRTLRSYEQYVKMLQAFFSETPLGRIGIDQVRAYQRWRQERAGASRINQEVMALQMIFREVDAWKAMQDIYRPLPVPKTKVRQSMSEDEERRLVVVALSSGKRRLVAGHSLIVMANTSMGFGELRHLKREDVFLDEEIPFVTVNGGTKNDFRVRTIPLNFLALRSVRWLLKRWEKLGGSRPEQYILPHNARLTPEQRANPAHRIKTSQPIFSEPASGIYSAARLILKEAGLGHLDP